MIMWKRLRHKQFVPYYLTILLWAALLLLWGVIYKGYEIAIIPQKTVIGILGVGVMLIIFMQLFAGRYMRITKKMENFVKSNKLYQYHYVTENGLFGTEKVQKIDYYPCMYYQIDRKNNRLSIKIRLDGSPYVEQLKELDEQLANVFKTVCTEKIETRKFLIYCFELKPQKQIKIQSCKDIPSAGEKEIVFSADMIWNWKKCPHLLLTGNTGSGKTQLAQYIILCLIGQGARVIYCDPKNDDEMRLFIESYPSVQYVSKENEIAKAVREMEEEVRAREKDLHRIGIEEAEFCPLFLLFDEMIAFSKIAEKKTYEETIRRLGSIVVTGRSKCVYAGLILQRPDTNFIEGAIRDNLGCRICMGQMSEAAYKMAFGSDFSNVRNNRREIGSGLIFRQGVDTKPREFLAPYIYEGALYRE